MGSGVILNAPGSGWPRLAEAVAAQIPVAEIDAVWVFRALRHEGREWGTAIVSRVTDAGSRRRIYTARYIHTLKGKERGKFESTLQEVGSGPPDTVGEIVAGVQRRMDDEVPTPVSPEVWFAPPPPAPLPSSGPTRQG
jgi:hypothetical protein